MSVGIVGLPNAGKTALFNALSRSGALVASYAFATVEPNVREVPLSDPRLDEFARLSKSRKIVPATVRFVDLAGLPEGASRGEGLGNRFLYHVRDVDAVVHVVRGYHDEIEEIDPVRDAELVETELKLYDLEILGRETDKARTAAKSGDGAAVERVKALEAVETELNQEIIPDRQQLAERLAALAPDMRLLILKPTLFVLNVDDDEAAASKAESGLAAWAAERNLPPVLKVNALIEAELSELDPEEAREFANEMGLEGGSLDRIIRASFEMLGLITFFTSGEKETRAWPIRKGLTAPQAAGKIHTDFERGFIKADVIHEQDFIDAQGSFSAARDAGTLRVEGRDYIFQDGDVVIFKFNV